jgi:GTPase SAR1 family protein
MNEQATKTIDMAVQAATAYGREDLASRLAATRRRLMDPEVRVLIVGEFKQGKSSLVNALLNAPVCPVDDDIATSVPTTVRHALEPAASVTFEPDEEHPEPRIEQTTMAELATYASEGGNPENRRRVRTVDVGIPRRLLEGGLVLIDTPGVGGLGSIHTAMTVAALAMADAVVFTSDASQEFTGPELEFLDMALGACPFVCFVMTKVDFYPEWKRIKDINEEHLRRRGVTAELMPTSAFLRQQAVRNEDRMLNTESGYPPLVSYLRDEVVGNAERRDVTMAVGDLRDVVGQLESSFRSEREMLEDPDRIAEVTRRLDQAREKAQELKSQAARWQITLNDGIADHSAEFDHALRARMRTTLRAAEEAIDEQDPAEVWEEFETWLHQRVSHDLAQTYLELTKQTDDLSYRVAEHFADGGSAVNIDLDPAEALRRANAITVRTQADATDPSLLGAGLTAMRGSYGGFLMFGMMARMAGMAMVNPATAAIGILMGGKAVRDERKRQVTIRRQQAKVTARQFIDDASFAAGKDLRDSLRAIQRNLRDHYSDRAEELNRSITESMTAAKSAASADQAERERRMRDVLAELKRLEALRGQVDKLAVGIEPGST